MPTGTPIAYAALEEATSSDGSTASACNQDVGTPLNVTVVRQGNYCTLTFIGNSTWTIPNGVTNVEAIIVGGGGGGGFGSLGGGGGAGEVLVSGNTTLASGEVTGSSTISVSPGLTTIVIGGGGTSGAPEGATATTANWAAKSATATKGGNGGSTSFGSVTADGGGGGGGSSPNNQGQAGGSGGGGAISGSGGATDSTTVEGWTSYKNTGQAGGAGGLAGGGGAGGTSSNGNGGSGILIWGVRLAGGGGGWGKLGAQGNLNDVILGGNGRLDTGNWPYAGTSNNSSPGAANTGTGGGAGAPGGSGIVIVRYLIVCELNAANTTSVNGGHTIVQVKNTDTCIWRVPSGVTSARILVIGGGGAGGGGIGGGGGAGEFVESTTALTPSTDIAIVVGSGGTPREWIGGNAGQNSSFSSIIAYGGGGGGTNEANGPTASQGPNLGSQGGGGYPNTVYTGSNPAPLIAVASASNSIRFRNNGGAGSGGNGSTATSGGGGGAGGVGAPGTTTNAGNGGAGKSSSITGSCVFYAAGGGGGVNGASSPGFSASIANGDPGVGGSGIGGNGGQEATSNPGNQYGNRGDGSNGTVDSRGSPGNANTGSGGGGASNWTVGGSGGSGIVVIRYITPPTILTQPSSDTTTVGTVDTLTISTSIALSPVTKSVQWQVTADTTTAVLANITGWTNLSAGTGFTTDTFTTIAVTKAMNKYRYRAVVTFSDTATLSVQVTSAVAVLTVNDAITITSDTSTITRKYGDSQTVRTFTYIGGTTNTGGVGTATSHTVRGQVGSLASGRILLDTSTATSVFRVDTRTAVGTYVETITVTDAKGATASYAQRVVVNPADTLTVQADTLTAMTYSPSGLVISPTSTLTGLVSGDTKDSVTFTYSSKNVSCANGGTCAVGNTGPGGGIVFYAVNGVYLEAAPAGWFGTATDTGTVWGCSGSTYASAYATAIGTGKANTDYIVSNCGDPTSSVAAKIARAYNGGGKSDWSLPSRDELIELCKYARTQTTGDISTSCTTAGTLNAGILKGFGNADGDSQYWSSSDASTNNAYTVWLSGRLSGGFGGKSSVRYVRPVRYFTSEAVNYGPTTTPPTNAGTYTVTPSNLTLVGGISTSNYTYINYLSSDFTINKARQDTLTITSKLAPYNGGTSTMKLTITGGTDTGTVTYAIVSGGTASGCSVSTNVLSYSSAGTCRLTATKAATLNYLIAYSDTVTITLSAFVSNQQVQTQSVPTQLPINGANSFETATVTAALLTITGVTNSGGGAYTILGTGFTNVSVVRIGGTDLVLNTNYTVTSTTAISITNASGMVGPLFIYLSDGQQAVRFEFPN